MPLNVVEELVAALQLDSGEEGNETEESSVGEETLMHISPVAMAGVQSRKSMRLQGWCCVNKCCFWLIRAVLAVLSVLLQCNNWGYLLCRFQRLR